MLKLRQFIKRLLEPLGEAGTNRSTFDDTDLSYSSRSHSNLTDFLNEFQQTLLRSNIATKWSTIDCILRQFQETASNRICPLCGFQSEEVQFGKLQSHCIFGGGHLLRHVCPSCEVTYGPDKMFALTADELVEDYNWHYKAYQEGDSTDREVRAFFSLNPDKRGVYLNYGAGCWSKSVPKLISEGWNVYAFEPHSSASSGTKYDWLITAEEELEKIRVDGIYSNNVLEHFRYPVLELQKMSKLLTEDGLMAHATPCFDYLYEFTRFHLFFFTGKSKDSLMEMAGLKLINEVIDGDFICRVMRPLSLGEDRA